MGALVPERRNTVGEDGHGRIFAVLDGRQFIRHRIRNGGGGIPFLILRSIGFFAYDNAGHDDASGLSAVVLGGFGNLGGTLVNNCLSIGRCGVFRFIVTGRLRLLLNDVLQEDAGGLALTLFLPLDQAQRLHVMENLYRLVLPCADALPDFIQREIDEHASLVQPAVPGRDADTIQHEAIEVLDLQRYRPVHFVGLKHLGDTEESSRLNLVAVEIVQTDRRNRSCHFNSLPIIKNADRQLTNQLPVG